MAQFMRARAQLLQRTPGLPEFDGLVEIATRATSWQYYISYETYSALCTNMV